MAVETTINNIERINLFILILGSLLSLLIMRDFKYFFSFAVASAIMTLNFRYLKKIIEGGFSRSTINKKDLFIKLPLKFIVLAGLVFVIIRFGDIDVIFFLVGLSTVFISIVFNQIFMAFSTAEKKEK
jgi:hypothetical protein